MYIHSFTSHFFFYTILIFYHEVVNAKYYCEETWLSNQENGLCYKLFPKPQSWKQARETCTREGGFLVSITSDRVMLFVAKSKYSLYDIPVSSTKIFVTWNTSTNINANWIAEDFKTYLYTNIWYVYSAICTLSIIGTVDNMSRSFINKIYRQNLFY